MLGPCVRSSFPGNWMCPTLPLLPPRELPRCKDPWWQGGKAFRALCPLPHHICSSPLWGEDLRAHWGERQRLCPSWDMAARCGELEWQGMEQTALGLFWGTMTLTDSEKKTAWTQLQWHFHPQVYFTLDTAHYLPVMTDLAGSDTDTHRHMSLGFPHMPQPWLTFCHYKMTETTWQAQSKQVISPAWCIHLQASLHFLIRIPTEEFPRKKKDMGRGMKPIPYKWWFVTYSPNWHLNTECSLRQNLPDTWIPVIWLITSHEWE